MSARRRLRASAIFPCSQSPCAGSTRASGSTGSWSWLLPSGRSRRSSSPRRSAPRRSPRASPAARPARRRCGSGSPRCPTTRRSCSCTTRRGRSCRPTSCRGCSRRSARASTAPCPGLPVADTVKRVSDGVVVETPRARRARRRSDAAGVRRERCCARRRPARAPTAPRSSRRPAAGSRSSPGDERLLKVTTPDDLRRVEALLAAEQE